MFSSNAFDNSKLIENCFIAGISNENVNCKKKSIYINFIPHTSIRFNSTERSLSS